MRTSLTILATLLSVTMAEAQAQRNQLWYQAYEAGVRDVARGAWDSAVQNLQAAKQSGPMPARRVVFYGDRIDAFNPDYYLGVAYLNLRRFADADTAFERVRQANLIPPNDKQYATFQTQASGAKGEVLFAQAEDLLGKGNAKLAVESADKAAALGIARARIQDLQQRAGNLQRLADATGTPAANSPAQTSPRPPPVEQQANLPAPAPMVTPVVEPPIAQQTTPPLSASQSPLPSANTLTKPSPYLPDGSVNVPRPVRPPQPPVPAPTILSERDGIAAFFSGRYDAAFQTLAAVAAAPQSSPRSRFYLACSLAALILSGDRDPGEIATARAELRGAQLDQLVADRRLVSPRVLAALAIQP